MRTVTGAVLRDGLDFRHVYDFGSSTLLKLTVLGPLPVPVPSRSVVLLARNDPPDCQCRECGGQAKWLCAECADEEAVFLCGACGRKHRCDQEMLRPVKNSPRMGVCGY